MKKMSIVFVAAVSLAAVGCKKTGGDCAKAIANSMEVSKADMPAGNEKMMAKMRDLGVQHCTDDKWSSDAIKCMTDAKTEAEAQGCYGKLTPEQRDKMNKSAMELSSPPGGGSAGAGGASGAGSAGGAMGSDAAGGSAAGSAGSGSAAGAGSDAPAGSASGSGSATAPK